MKSHSFISGVLLLWGTVAFAQVPADGLRLEGEGRWREALALYETIVRAEPGRADLWVRISDIHARLDEPAAAIEALTAALAAAPTDADLMIRLSRAYAAHGHPVPALETIRGVLALRPGDSAVLRAAGELAMWNTKYGEARGYYRALLSAEPNDAPSWLAFARACAWDGATDQAVTAYREYIERSPDDQSAWLEWARAESWRGNDAGAAGVLARFRERFPESREYRRALATVTLRGGRPGRALGIAGPLATAMPLDHEFHWLVGLAHVGRGDARRAAESHGRMQALAPERAETTGLGNQIRAAFGSSLHPRANVYADSDGLRVSRLPASAAFTISPELRVSGGYERQDLRARLASGLERADGGATAHLEGAWAGAEIRLAPAALFHIQAGRQSSAWRDAWTYGAGLAVRFGDRARLSLGHDRSLFAVSPRTVSLGLRSDTTRGRISLAPSYRFFVDAEGSLERISDDNQRYTVAVTPRFATVRRQRLNMDVGVSVHRFGSDRDLEHGYYDPELYEAYSLVLLPYFKFSENTGLSLLIQAGLQRDERQDGFEPGGNAAAELTVGIYRAWVLKLSGSSTINSRLESGAFRGTSVGIGLNRRF